MAAKIPASVSCFLDLLRGLSAQVVVIGHGMSFGGIGFFMRPPNFPLIQNIAVVVFFFLSGFVIAMSIAARLGRGGYSFPEFLLDRAIRFGVTIIPCLLIIAAIDFCLMEYPTHVRYAVGMGIEPFLGNLAMLQRHPLFSIPAYGSGAPLWSIAVEWWLYVFFGYMFLLPHTSKWKAVLFAVLPLLAWPMVSFFLFSYAPLPLPWFLGALAYAVLPRIPQPSNAGQWFGAAVIGACFVYSLQEYIFSMKGSYSAQGIVAITAVLFAATYAAHSLPDPRKWLMKTAHFLASFSFTLYCLHYTIYAMLKALNVNGPVLFVVGFVLSNVVSIAVAYATEMRYPAVRAWIKGRAGARG